MASHSYRTQLESSANQTNYTFTAADIGTAASGRLVVVGVASAASSGSRDVSSMTIGGVSATLAIRESSSSAFTSEIWYAAVPTGTTGDIVVNHSGAMIACSVGVWALYDVTATPANTAQSTISSTTIDIPANGIVVGNGHTAGSVTWTGATENFDDPTLGDASGSGHSGASRQATTAETGTTVSTTGGSTFLTVASWSPLAATTGDLSVTEANDSISAAGIVEILGTFSATEAADTFASDGTVPIVAAATITEADDTLSSDATLGEAGAIALVTEDDDTVSAAGVLDIQGAATITEADDSLSAAGVVPIVGTATLTEADDALVAAAALAIIGAAAIVEDGDLLSSASLLAILAAAGIIEADDALLSSAVISQPIRDLGRGRISASAPYSRVSGRVPFGRTSVSAPSGRVKVT